MCDKQDRKATDAYTVRERDGGAGHGYIPNAKTNVPFGMRANVIAALQQRAADMRMKADGLERMAELVGAANEGDHKLFTVLGEIMR